MITASINGGALLKMLYSSLIAGVSVAVVFSLAVLGAAQAGEMRRERRGAASIAFGALAVIALLVSAGIVVYGLILLTRK